MTGPSFAELVARLVEALGQQVDSMRRGPEGILLRTGDGFVFAFLEDPSVVSLAVIGRLLKEVGATPVKLVVLTPGRLPLALQAELLRHGATVVESTRFAELARSLGLGSFLGEEPRGEPKPTSGRLLPSAHQLDEIMGRARKWLDWGVPALALRFFRQASTFKPEFLPARDGIGRSLLKLGLTEDADRTFDEVLESHPDDTDARLGKAAILGARGKVAEEVTVYRQLLEAEPARLDIRTHLVAALIAEKEWATADGEVETMLNHAPEDPVLRFLHSATLERTGHHERSREERERARRLGLARERENALSEHLGLPVPIFPEEPLSLPKEGPPASTPVAPRSAPPKMSKLQIKKRPPPGGRRAAARALPSPSSRKAKKRPAG